ncbi:MAG: DUF11 domain-containing protein, partial [Gemmatimonadota bacterium]
MIRLHRIAVAGLLSATTLLACSETPPTVLDIPEEPLADVTGTPNKQFWKQCQNNQDKLDDCDWVTGNLNQTHNIYEEGDFVPKVLRVNSINNTDPFEIEMTYGFLKGGKTTHDFLGLWNEDMVNANPCTESNFDVPSFCTVGDVLQPIDFISLSMDALSQGAVDAACGAASQHSTDMAEAIVEATPAKMVIQGINMSSIVVDSINFDGCPAAGDAEAFLFMTVTPTAAATVASGDDGILLLFGAHVARSDIWDNGGAGDVNGSPYHLGLVTLDGESAGSMDLQMSANVLVSPPELAIRKDALADTVSAGDTIGFRIVVSNNGTGPATNVVLTDTLPDSGLNWTEDPDNTDCSIGTIAGPLQELICLFGDIAAGDSAFVTLKSPTDAADCGTVTNKAWAVADNDTTVMDTADVVVQCPNLMIKKTALADTVSAGDSIGFKILVWNPGPGVA